MSLDIDCKTMSYTNKQYSVNRIRPKNSVNRCILLSSVFFSYSVIFNIIFLRRICTYLLLFHAVFLTYIMYLCCTSNTFSTLDCFHDNVVRRSIILIDYTKFVDSSLTGYRNILLIILIINYIINQPILRAFSRN